MHQKLYYFQLITLCAIFNYANVAQAKLVWAIDTDIIEPTGEGEHLLHLWSTEWDFKGREGCWVEPTGLQAASNHAIYLPQLTPTLKSLVSNASIASKKNLRGRDLNVFPEDDRIYDINYTYPSRTIGRFDNEYSYCTSEFIAPHLTSTNAHCVVIENENGERRLPTKEELRELSFYPAVRNNMANDQSGIAAFVMDDAYLMQNATLTSDWAIVLTVEDLGLKYGWLGMESTDIDTTSLENLQSVSLSGFSGDKCSETPCIHKPCQIKGTISEIGLRDFMHNCDSTGGSSGSAILNENNTMVALHHAHFVCESCGTAYSENNANLAVETKGMVNALLQNALAFQDDPDLGRKFDQPCGFELSNPDNDIEDPSGSESDEEENDEQEESSDTSKGSDDSEDSTEEEENTSYDSSEVLDSTSAAIRRSETVSLTGTILISALLLFAN